jgi:hypothetical protein
MAVQVTQPVYDLLVAQRDAYDTAVVVHVASVAAAEAARDLAQDFSDEMTLVIADLEVV